MSTCESCLMGEIVLALGTESRASVETVRSGTSSVTMKLDPLDATAGLISTWTGARLAVRCEWGRIRVGQIFRRDRRPFPSSPACPSERSRASSPSGRASACLGPCKRLSRASLLPPAGRMLAVTRYLVTSGREGSRGVGGALTRREERFCGQRGCGDHCSVFSAGDVLQQRLHP